MASVTIRATASTRNALNELAKADGITVPDLLGQLAERELERRLLYRGLAALANMNDTTRDAYLGEWQDWDDAPLDEPVG